MANLDAGTAVASCDEYTMSRVGAEPGPGMIPVNNVILGLSHQPGTPSNPPEPCHRGREGVAPLTGLRGRAFLVTRLGEASLTYQRMLAKRGLSDYRHPGSSGCLVTWKMPMSSECHRLFAGGKTQRDTYHRHIPLLWAVCPFNVVVGLIPQNKQIPSPSRRIGVTDPASS
ncbi:hypothetical protein VUR80DRAFT_6274 [Thermomyces stellatus]